jgi:DHA2 family multidrug resistance protein-like MFS transporter
VYRSVLAGNLPAGIPPVAVAAARDTLGGAVGVAAQLPNPLGLALLDSARDAFVQGLHLAAGISAVVAITGAIVAVIVLRHVPAGAQTERQSDLDCTNGAVIEFTKQEARHAA